MPKETNNIQLSNEIIHRLSFSLNLDVFQEVKCCLISVDYHKIQKMASMCGPWLIKNLLNDMLKSAFKN
jgi:hypothetical protein